MKMENGVIKMTDVEAFIIPNGAFKISDIVDLSVRKRVLDKLNSVASASGLEPVNPDVDKLVDLWYVSKEADSENLISYGFEIDQSTVPRAMLNYFDIHEIASLPVKWLSGLKENDSIDLVIERDIYKIESYDYKIECHITMTQLKYRYRDRGAFEKALASLAKVKYK